MKEKLTCFVNMAPLLIAQSDKYPADILPINPPISTLLIKALAEKRIK